ncbi:B2 protein [Selaginella moellendorffii]|uniref:B2 protein n=1 Tax=Selaginella moellendorffii TaxID=88036 RepID=UPI000D1CF6FB|nr:B2 protein [Selaginella moellendorffii]|eukprot:XP_002980634.2 B2 protein [Selaginella moellendorffii]
MLVRFEPWPDGLEGIEPCGIWKPGTLATFWNLPDEPVDHKAVDWKWRGTPSLQSLQAFKQHHQAQLPVLGKQKFDPKPRITVNEVKKVASDLKRGGGVGLGNPKQSFLEQKQANLEKQQGSSGLDKRFKTLPPSEMLPRNETLGGYIFVCNNDTMQEDLKRQLFGLPQRYRDSVRAIQPGLPLFLYNYTTHQLHGVYEAASFGGSNIDPTAWEDKKCRGESRFPAQVRIRVRMNYKPLEEDAFRPVLHHYDGPKFRLQLSVPETLMLLDLFSDKGSA